MSRKYPRVDAAFAIPDLFDYLEANGFGYATWLRADKVLEFCIAYLLKRIPERLSNTIERHDAGDNLLHQGEGASAMTDGIDVASGAACADVELCPEFDRIAGECAIRGQKLPKMGQNKRQSIPKLEKGAQDDNISSIRKPS